MIQVFFFCELYLVDHLFQFLCIIYRIREMFYRERTKRKKREERYFYEEVD